MVQLSLKISFLDVLVVEVAYVLFLIGVGEGGPGVLLQRNVPTSQDLFLENSSSVVTELR